MTCNLPRDSGTWNEPAYDYCDGFFDRAIEHSAYGATTRPLCDLTSQVPVALLQSGKKLKVLFFCALCTHLSVVFFEL